MSVDALSSLSKTDFLNLLATQLRYQNPMDPMDNTEFIAQLAQFSALEAAENTNTEISNLSTKVDYMQAAAWLGKNALGLDSTTQELFSGTVEAIDFTGSEAMVVVGGQSYPLTDILQVEA